MPAVHPGGALCPCASIWSCTHRCPTTRVPFLPIAAFEHAQAPAAAAGGAGIDDQDGVGHDSAWVRFEQGHSNPLQIDDGVPGGVDQHGIKHALSPIRGRAPTSTGLEDLGRACACSSSHCSALTERDVRRGWPVDGHLVVYRAKMYEVHPPCRSSHQGREQNIPH